MGRIAERHSFGPYFEGMENPYDQYDSEENRKEYDLQQRQRAMERRIRDSKRKCMGLKHGVDSATTDEAKASAEALYQKEAALLQKRNKAYNDFCEENGLKRKSERITIAQWDREQAAKARAAAKKYKKSLENPQKNGRMKIDTGGRRNEKPLSVLQQKNAEDAARKQGYPGEIFYSDYSSTAFHGSPDNRDFHFLVIGTDAYPVATSQGSAIERISLSGCMAHEVVGHYEAWIKGTTQNSFPLEEAQASIRASKFGVGLDDDERKALFQDAIDRLESAGIFYDDVKDLLDIWER